MTRRSARLRALTVLFVAVPALGNDDPLVFSGMGYSGDGVTPTFGAYLSALAPEPTAAKHLASAGANGELDYSIGIQAPDALLPGSMALRYSSGRGRASWIARGWSIDSGIRIDALDLRDQRGAYRDTPDLYRISGQVSGLLEPVEADSYGYRLVSQSGDFVVADYDEVSTTWTVWAGGVTSTVTPRLTTDEPRSWHTTHQTDASANEVHYAWTNTRLDAIEYGGNALSPDDQWPSTVRLELQYDPVEESSVHRSHREGTVEVFDGAPAGWLDERRRGARRRNW